MEPWGIEPEPPLWTNPPRRTHPGAVSKVSGPCRFSLLRGAGRFRICNIVADKLNSTMVDAIHQVVAERLRELHVEPLTAYGLTDSSKPGRDP